MRYLMPAVAVGGVVYGCWQGYTLRNKFKASTQLNPPAGPQDGVAPWMDRVVAMKEEIAGKMRTDDSFIGDGIKRIKDLIEQKRASAEQQKDNLRDAIFQRRKLKEILRGKQKKLKPPLVASGVAAVPPIAAADNAANTAEAVIQAAVQDVCVQATALREKYHVADAQAAPRRQVKLLVVGDSLVSGVGIEGANARNMSPVLPKLVAEVLSCTLKADVEWYCAGYVGADAHILRESVIPEVKERMFRADARNSALPRKQRLAAAATAAASRGRSSTTGSSSSSAATAEAVASTNSAGASATAGGSMLRRLLPGSKVYFFPFFSGGDIDMNPYQQEDETENCNLSTSNSSNSSSSKGSDGVHTTAATEAQKAPQPSALAQNEEAELIVIIICGLNDWKHMLEHFPQYGFGPSTFRQELSSLIRDVQVLGTELKCKSCRIFLPTMPLTCIQDDPNFILGVRPLRYMVDWLFYMWDLQKQLVAEEDEQVLAVLAVCVVFVDRTVLCFFSLFAD